MIPVRWVLPASWYTAMDRPRIEIGIDLEGIFRSRPNRFLGLVETDEGTLQCHVPNPGRMFELLYPGSQVMLSRAVNPLRKTSFDLVAVDCEGEVVSVDSRLPNRLVHSALVMGWLPQFDGYTSILKEYHFGESRIDFLLQNGKDCLLEVKSCTLIEGKRALFPDAPTVRGRRHLSELVRARMEGNRSAVVFVIQRSGAGRFSPNWGTDPEFSRTLQRARELGVEVYAYGCEVDRECLTMGPAVEVEIGTDGGVS